MFRRLTTRRILATTSGGIAAIGLFAGLALAQQRNGPMFFDARRLPDMEVERRNQDVLQEQRRVAEERRQDAEATSKRKIDEARLAAEAERKAAAETARADEARLAADAQRKADDETRVAAEADAKKKAEDARLEAIADATQRKADADKRAIAEADAKKQAEEVRLAALAEAQRKADEDKRAAVELDAKKKAEQVRLAAVAEAQRKADEEKRIAAEADTKKKAEETRLAAVAEAQRKSDEERTAAADAKKKAEEARLADAARKTDAARKADEERKLAAANAAPPVQTQPQAQPQTTALLAPPATNEINPASPTSCDAAKISTQPLIGGRMQITVDSACRKGQPVAIKYGTYDFVRKLDGNGRGTIIVDLFLGKGEGVKLNYADGRDDAVAPVTSDLNEVSKVALIWQSPVDLDLHAFENGAVTGKAGHIWSGSASTAEAAKAQMNETGRGAGFLSTAGDGQTEGTKIEVYTFFVSPEQRNGVVAISLDYATRGSTPSGDYCGTGAKATVPYEGVSLSAKGNITRERGVIAAAACGSPLQPSARFLRDAIPDLEIGQ